jgi:hypothetical protein
LNYRKKNLNLQAKASKFNIDDSKLTDLLSGYFTIYLLVGLK